MEGVRLAILLCVYVLHITSGKCPGGTYGYQCSYNCNCPNATCDFRDGCRNQTCNRGWSGPTCQKYNKALGKPTSASCVHLHQSPSKAVDGVTIASHDSFCFHSAFNDASIADAWWRVDLSEMTQIHDVTIYLRTDHKVRRNGIQIYTAETDASPPAGDHCYNLTGKEDGTDIPDVLNVTCSGNGRYLVLYTTVKHSGDTVPILDFCEVQVDVCSPGTFGSDCDTYCHCDGEVCDYVSGICPSGYCLPGWKQDKCDTECIPAYYGLNCNKKCSDRNCKTDNSSCDHVTGECVGGCLTGLNGTDCTQKCTLGKYGPNCNQKCYNRNCEDDNSSCDHVTGECVGGCMAGWNGTDCTQKCKPGTFGPDCSRCGYCDVTCNVGDGHCPGDCLDGFTGDRCDVDVRVSSVTSGVIGGAIGMAVMLLLIAGLTACLIRTGRLTWRSSACADPKDGRNMTVTDTGEIPAHAHVSGVDGQDYVELNDLTREEDKMSTYNVIQN
ncbi:multiple epidermal growth factor-like domains protein 10 [Haliotis rufescens]|uniref:multiple epidermal growth factor-like domains protein 10 n=1 Tax=Haliotis rufescens TaxID=6454 RepID=UPI00201EDBA9|nr:multiple epidermal growth factor-like domains protein 10 [Haliotis rufescens]